MVGSPVQAPTPAGAMSDEQFESSTAAEALLRKHNPILVLFPEKPERERPGRYSQGEKGRGDYHPCAAELFLSQVSVHLETRKNKRDYSAFAGVGIQALQDALRHAPEPMRDSAGWEIDLDDFARNNATQAWWKYHEVRNDYEDLYGDHRTVYGRVRRTSNLIALQYWYFYFYNDSANKHEGDWETVTVLLKEDADGGEPQPILAAYAGHAGGVKRPWRGVSRIGDRPLVYVARGSHAAYLDHMSFGYHVAHIEFRKDRHKKWRETLYKLIFGVPSRWLFFLGVRDYTAPLESYDARMVGEHVYPALKVLPKRRSREEDLPTEWWWLHLDCPWGSSRPAAGPLGSEFLAPDPPWRTDLIWQDPVKWALNQRTR